MARRIGQWWQGEPLWRRALYAVLVLLLAGRLCFRAAATAQVQAAVPALRGKVIVVDPGHGGVDNGAIGVSGVREKDVALAVALKLRDRLAAAGATVVLTRDTDRDLRDEVPPLDGSRRRGELAARAALAEKHGAHVFVSIHANKHGRNTPWKGAQTFWDPRGQPEGERLARVLMEVLRHETPTQRVHRPIEQLVLARSGVPAATVEVGFLSNAEEERRLTDPAYQERLAQAIAGGIARFLAGAP